MRDAPHAKRAKVIVQNNVVGPGIGLQAQVMSTRGELRESVNDALEKAFCEWSCAERCHTGGTLHFADLERALMGQVFEAGEVFVRKHARAFGDSAVPFALELIEPERLLEEFMQPVPQAPLADGAVVKMGIEVDRFGRPLAYWIRNRHPGDLQFLHGETNKIERVPAEQIMHLRLVDRWPQTRGEPWLHAVARKLNDMDGYTEAEIVAARAAASYVFTIETPEPNTPLANEITATAGAATSKEVVVEAGMGLRLAPGEKWETHSPNRPNPALDAFMRYMLREVAAGAGVSYESLSRDYSQSNYSSSRLALLDDRDLWKMLQQWFIRNFREPLHREWLRAAVLAAPSPASRSPNTRSTPPSSRRRASSRAAGAGSTRPRKSRPPRKPSRPASPRAPTSSPRPPTGATSRTSTASACASSTTRRSSASSTTPRPRSTSPPRPAQKGRKAPARRRRPKAPEGFLTRLPLPSKFRMVLTGKRPDAISHR
jgi:lambda family phage portal protein